MTWREARKSDVPLLGVAMRTTLFILSFWFVLSTACAPVISKENLKTADRQLEFGQILRNPDAYRGKTVLLGGSIIKTTPFPEKTQMVVLQHPLGYRDKPAGESISMGRFILSAPGFFDPAIYRAGRLVTVVGTVTGKETRTLGEIEYTYPHIANKELYLWPVEEIDTRPRFYFGVGVGKTF